MINVGRSGDVTNIRQPSNSAWPQLGNNRNIPQNEPYIDSNSKSTTSWPVLGQSRHQQQSNLPQNNGPPNSNRQPTWVRPDNGPNWVRNTNNGVTVNTNADARANTQTNNGVRGSSSVNSPTRNSANYNTNFLNIERGSVGTMHQSGLNQRQTVSNPNQNQKSSNFNINSGMRNPASSEPKQGGNLNQGTNNKNTNMGGLSPLLPLAEGGGSQNQNSNNNNNNNGMKGAISTGSMNTDSGSQGQSHDQGSNPQNSDGGVEDYELREFSEELLTKDTNNAARYVTVNLQGMTTSRSMNDEAPLP
ncbi:hypothetical protein NQ314_004714 [Rhamnusium bicolor]|uniref:EndoU domain-containing protein n=1 Tax=Rhamnusium bicolor TaxID=1586634 RepID=A0AAV8ZIS0_9CUCU|nr:hypothetical protein NQ314_004714 [Rhamnusium bicolor]